MQLTLSEAFTYLLSAQQKNFYARIISSLIRYEKPGLGTMAVGIRDGKLCFYYDPAFLQDMMLQELVLTCEHELIHLVYDHIPRFLDLYSAMTTEEERRRFRAVMNVATDLADNEVMRSAKNFDNTSGPWFYGDKEKTKGRSFILPETFGLSRAQPYEVYHFQLLRDLKKTTMKLGKDGELSIYGIPMPGAGKDEKPQQGQEPGQGQGQKEKGKSKQGQEKEQKQGGGAGQQQDPVAVLSAYFNGKTGGAHQFWAEELEGKNPEEIAGMADKARQEIKNIINTAVQEQQKSRGTVPAHLSEMIDKILAPPKIPWPKILRDLCSRTRQTKIDRGMARPSRRRYGVPGVLPFPGRSRDSKFTIGFALDTSGSMSTDDLALGLQEIMNIVRTEDDVTLWVMYADADLNTIYNVESVQDIKFEVGGRGGTDFNPVFIKVREMLQSDTQACDVLIYATDGYAPAPAVDNRLPIPVAWLITPTGRVPSEDYGIHIPMEPF